MTADEIICTISTEINGADSPLKIIQSISNIFPEIDVGSEQFKEPTFPTKSSEYKISFECSNVDEFIEKISKQRILDTAMDAMSHNLNDNHTYQKQGMELILNQVAFLL